MNASRGRGRVRSARGQAGAAVVEFAIVCSVLFMILAGVVEFGRVLWYYDALVKATRDAARYVSVQPIGSLTTAETKAKEMVRGAALAAGVPGFIDSQASVACNPTACGSALAPAEIATVTVSVTYPVTLGAWLPFVFGPASYTATMSPHTTMRYMW